MVLVILGDHRQVSMCMLINNFAATAVRENYKLEGHVEPKGNLYLKENRCICT